MTPREAISSHPRLVTLGVAAITVAGAVAAARALLRRRRDTLHNPTAPPDVAACARELLLKTPYVMNRGGMVVLYGSISKEGAKRMMSAEKGVRPRPREDGRVPCGIVLANFNGNIGPHTELQFTIPCHGVDRPLPMLPTVPYACALGLLEAGLAVSLFNNTSAAVKYNTHLLGHKVTGVLGGRTVYEPGCAGKSSIELDVRLEDGTPLLQARLAGPSHPDSALIDPLRFAGHLSMGDLLSSVVFGVHTRVVNRGANLAASTYTYAPDTLMSLAGEGDCVEVSEAVVPRYADFVHECTAMMGDAVNPISPFLFIYLYNNECV